MSDAYFAPPLAPPGGAGRGLFPRGASWTDAAARGIDAAKLEHRRSADWKRLLSKLHCISWLQQRQPLREAVAMARGLRPSGYRGYAYWTRSRVMSTTRPPSRFARQ